MILYTRQTCHSNGKVKTTEQTCCNDICFHGNVDAFLVMVVVNLHAVIPRQRKHHPRIGHLSDVNGQVVVIWPRNLPKFITFNFFLVASQVRKHPFVLQCERGVAVCNDCQIQHIPRQDFVAGQRALPDCYWIYKNQIYNFFIHKKIVQIFSLQAFISDAKNHLQDALLFHILKYCHLNLQQVIE